MHLERRKGHPFATVTEGDDRHDESRLKFGTFGAKPIAMFRILLPTDFSATAEKAAHFALHVYGTREVRYTLVNSYPLQNYADTFMPDLTVMAEEDSRNGLQREAERLQKDTDQLDLELVSTYVTLPQALNEFAAEHGGDVVVMGTQGKGSNRFFGRYASTMIERAQLPVITVPARWEPEPITRILLTMDGGPFEAGTLDVLVDLAGRCGAEVVVAHVQTNTANPSQGLDHTAMDATLKDIAHSYLTGTGANVVDTMNTLAMDHRIQLVAMVHRQRGFLDGLFHTSHTKQMALHTKLPLLVLRHG